LFPDTIIKGKVKVVPVLLTKHHAMSAYPMFSQATRHEDILRE